MTETLPSRTVLITGGSRGIGAACVKAMAKDHVVYFTYRSNKTSAFDLSSSLNASGHDTHPIEMDVTQSKSIETGIQEIVKNHGGVDVLINNAGVSHDQLLIRSKPEMFEQTFQTNVQGAFEVTRQACKTMLKRKNHGRILFMSSVVGQMGNAGQSLYSASKAALIGLSKSLAKELASRAITVNAIAPGFIETDMTDALTDGQKEAMLSKIPLKRSGQAEDIANVVRFLCSKEAAYITGQVIAVNGGLYL